MIYYSQASPGPPIWGTNVQMPKTTGHISHSNHDTVNHGETGQQVAAAAAQVVGTVRKKERDEQLFSVHFLFLYNPGSYFKKDGSSHDQQV